MLLTSLSNHVEDQNWFAVAVDFCIVVVGVFIGIQVANWNAERGRAQLEANYISRLHDDVVRLIATRADNIRYRDVLATHMDAASRRLFDANGGPLSSVECISLRSVTVSNPTDELAVVIELLGSGGLASIRDSAITGALSDYLLVRARARDSQAGVAQFVIDLQHHYPELIQTRKHPEEWQGLERYLSDDESFLCDTNGMRSNPGFLNDMSDNFNLVQDHVAQNERVSAALARLHDVIDAKLGLDHKGGAP